MKALEMALEALKNPSVIVVQYAIHLLQEELAKPKLTNQIKRTQHMNGRLAILAEQAGYFIKFERTGQDVTVVRTKEPGADGDLALFAELIVQECGDIVEQAKKSPFVSLDDAKRMSHFVDVTKKKIQKHFGVKND